MTRTSVVRMVGFLMFVLLALAFSSALYGRDCPIRKWSCSKCNQSSCGGSHTYKMDHPPQNYGCAATSTDCGTVVEAWCKVTRVVLSGECNGVRIEFQFGLCCDSGWVFGERLPEESEAGTKVARNQNCRTNDVIKDTQASVVLNGNEISPVSTEADVVAVASPSGRATGKPFGTSRKKAAVRRPGGSEDASTQGR